MKGEEKKSLSRKAREKDLVDRRLPQKGKHISRAVERDGARHEPWHKSRKEAQGTKARVDERESLE